LYFVTYFLYVFDTAIRLHKPNDTRNVPAWRRVVTAREKH